MDCYRRISPADLATDDLAQRRRHLGLARSTAWLFCHPSLFQQLLSRQLNRLSTERCGFSLPSAWAVAACGQNLQFNCPPGQLALQLTDWVGCEGKRWHVNDYFLGTGDWTPLLKPSADTFVAKEAEELHACALDYRATRSYAVLKQAALDGRPVRRQQVLLDQPEHVDRYFERFVELFRSIEERGVLSCARLRGGRQTLAMERDIGVAIGIDGEIIRLPGGQHRTAIARVLGLERLPVEVRLVHIAWLGKITAARKERPLLALYHGISQLAPLLA